MVAFPSCAPVAQLDRASDYESAGRVFESPRARSLSTPYNLIINDYGPLFEARFTLPTIALFCHSM